MSSKSKGIIYLASPYSSPFDVIRERRYINAMLACAQMIKDGKLIYSPIVHWHEVAKRYSLPKDAAFWETLNNTFLMNCVEVRVLTLAGWEDSLGIQAEVNLAIHLDIPVSYWGIQGGEVVEVVVKQPSL